MEIHTESRDVPHRDHQRSEVKPGQSHGSLLESLNNRSGVAQAMLNTRHSGGELPVDKWPRDAKDEESQNVRARIGKDTHWGQQPLPGVPIRYTPPTRLLRIGSVSTGILGTADPLILSRCRIFALDSHGESEPLLWLRHLSQLEKNGTDLELRCMSFPVSQAASLRRRTGRGPPPRSLRFLRRLRLCWLGFRSLGRHDLSGRIRSP